MRRLSGIDSDMFYGETASNHMHVSALMVLDPSTAPGGFGIDTWKRLIAGQVQALPPLREKLLEVPLRIDRPLWINDPHFHLDRHIRRIAVPAPGGSKELATLVGDLSSYKLDSSGPLWENWFIEGLEGDRVGLLFRIHHACVDGMASSLMLGQLLSIEPTTPIPPDSPWKPVSVEEVPSRRELLIHGLGSMALTPVRAIRTLKRTATSMKKMIGLRNANSWRSAALPFQAPRTSLNQPVTPRRSFCFTSVSLSEVKTIKNAFGVKVNDVIMALCSGALRHYLEKRGEVYAQPLIAAIPVSVRARDQAASFGNVVSGMFASLATHIDDPVERLLAIAQGARSAKEIFSYGLEDIVMEWAQVPSPATFALAARLSTWMHLSERLPPLYNLLISNVPGPPVPLYAGGARLTGCYPTGPLVGNVGLNITVLSYDDCVNFGIMSCPDIVPDLEPIRQGIGDALAELAERVRAGTSQAAETPRPTAFRPSIANKPLPGLAPDFRFPERNKCTPPK